MKALAHSSLRIRTASDRLPRLTGRGISGLQKIASDLAAAFHRTAPTLVILLLNFFR